MGDYVRIDKRTKDKVKMGLIKIKSSRVSNYTKEYYKVTSVNENKSGVEVYTLDID